eukprot:COSAG04_NODE_2036_length_4958_cov_2.183165_3_plen_70_part_00
MAGEVAPPPHNQPVANGDFGRHTLVHLGCVSKGVMKRPLLLLAAAATALSRGPAPSAAARHQHVKYMTF